MADCMVWNLNLTNHWIAKIMPRWHKAHSSMTRFFWSLVSGRFEAATIPESLVALWFALRIRVVLAFLSHHSSTFFESFSSHSTWASCPKRQLRNRFAAGTPSLCHSHHQCHSPGAEVHQCHHQGCEHCDTCPDLHCATAILAILYSILIQCLFCWNMCICLCLFVSICIYLVLFVCIWFYLSLCSCFSQKLSTFNRAGQVQAAKRQKERSPLKAFVLSLFRCVSFFGDLQWFSDWRLAAIKPMIWETFASEQCVPDLSSLPSSSQDTPHHLPRQTMGLRPQYCTLSMPAIHCAANHRHLQSRLKEGGDKYQEIPLDWRFESLNYLSANTFSSELWPVGKHTSKSCKYKWFWRTRAGKRNQIWSKPSENTLGSTWGHWRFTWCHLGSGLSLGFRHRLWPPCEWRSRHQRHSSLLSPRITFEKSSAPALFQSIHIECKGRLQEIARYSASQDRTRRII